MYQLADNILSQAFFGLYEFFANIVPGTIILATIVLMFQVTLFSTNGLFSESLQLLLFVLIAFIIGLAMQALSSLITKNVEYPSKHYLEIDDKGGPSAYYFPDYMKKDIRKSANQMFGTPQDASSQDVFDACYIYLLQNKVTTRLQTFLYAYTLARSMIATLIVEFALFLSWSLINPQSFSYRFEPLFLLTALAAIALTKVFNGLFHNYQKAFAKEVLKSFFINCHQKTSSSGNPN